MIDLIYAGPLNWTERKKLTAFGSGSGKVSRRGDDQRLLEPQKSVGTICGFDSHLQSWYRGLWRNEFCFPIEDGPALISSCGPRS